MTYDSDLVKTFYKMSKKTLIELHKKNTQMIWSKYPLEKWSKDEIINDLLQLEVDPRCS